MYFLYNPTGEKVPALINQKVSLTEATDLFNIEKKLDLLSTAYSKKIIHIFTTWCGCCKKELPELQKLAENYKITGLVWTQNAEGAGSWLQSNGNHYEEVGIINDKEAVKLGLYKSPVTLVLDVEGNVQCALQGPLTVEKFNDNIALCIVEKR
ncbi:MAG: hypothetical protein MRQ13_04675 [Candidatus Midichloria sp.]|nr:hypothetical protein [Candidatus Midichloria sp.]